LKLAPIFCVSVAARFTKQTFLFACAIASFIYLGLILEYIFLIRRNVPTTFILSYGYKSIFLGLDHIRSEAGLSPIGLSDTWLPASTADFRDRWRACQTAQMVSEPLLTLRSRCRI
jgi:hypothetical protein